MRHHTAIGLLVCVVGAACARADMLVADYTHNRVMRFSQADGSLIDPNFIQFGSDDGIPFDIVQVGDEIWVGDIALRQIARYSLDGSTRLGTITGFDGALNGMQYVAEEDAVFVVIGHGSGDDGIARVDVGTNSITGSFLTFGALDVTSFEGSLLVSVEDRDRLDRYDYDGTYLGQFADLSGGAGLREPSQLDWRSDGTLAVGAAGFGPDDGGVAVYGTDGSLLGSWETDDGVIGLGELDSGSFLVTLNSEGYVAVFDPILNTLIRVGPADARCFFLSQVTIPAPGGAALLGLGAWAGCRRRR